MSMYRATFITNIEITVEVEADDDGHAADSSWNLAQDYLDVLPIPRGGAVVSVEASLDGIGALDVTEI